MRLWTWRAIVLGTAIGSLVVGSARLTAHNPITSRYTYNTDAFPILRARCGGCHMEGGIAPMSLLTHAEAAPWAESIRQELLSGHMPPWQIDSPSERIRNASALTPHDLDVLLTWATGGTPVGETSAPAPVRANPVWRLGTPDRVLRLPEVTLSESQVEDVKEFKVPLGLSEERWIRAVDLRPGTPAFVRSATITAMTTSSRGNPTEQVLALWQPGDEPIALESNTGFRLPPSATLVARVHYKKTWRDAQRAMSDASTIGVYFATGSPRSVQPLLLAPAEARGPLGSENGPLTFVHAIDRDMTALSIYPDITLSGVSLKVELVSPNGTRDTLVAMRVRSGWARRYWFNEPVALPRGGRLEVTARSDDTLLAPQAPRIPVRPLDSAAFRLVMDVY
jgi:hypothetical protein